MFAAGGIGAARRFGSDGGAVPILQYHSVSPDGDYRSPSLAVSPRLFERQAAYLARHYRVVSLDEIVARLRDGAPFPARAVAITFDDGYVDNVLIAYPLLVKYGLTATFFVTAGPVVRGERFWVAWLRRRLLRAATVERVRGQLGLPPPERAAGRDERALREDAISEVGAWINRGGVEGKRERLAAVERALGGEPDAGPDACMMQPDHLREMVLGGMTIGSHTVSHPNLPSATADDIRRELVDSRTLLEGVVDHPVRHLAYPGGPDPGNPIHAAAVIDLAREAGYQSACTSSRGVVAISDDPFTLRRREANDRLGFSGFAFQLERHRFEDARPIRRRLSA